MVPRLFLITIMSFVISVCFARDEPATEKIRKFYRNRVDSLYSIYLADKQKVSFDICYKLSEAYMPMFSGDSARTWAKRAIEIAQRDKNPSEIIDGLRAMGVVEETKSKNYRSALSYYLQASELAKQNGYEAKLHLVYTSVLNLYFYLGDFVNAMKYASDGLNFAERAKDAALIAHYQNLVGFIHLRQDNPLDAERYFKFYLAYGEDQKDSLVIADAFNSLAESAIARNQFDLALSFLKRSFSIYNKFYNEKRLPKVDRIPYTLFRTGYCYGAEKKYDSAMPFVLSALEYTKILPSNLYDIAQYNIYAGNLYVKTGRYQNAAVKLHAGLALSKFIDHKEDIRDAYFYLQELFSKKKQYDSAYYYYRLYAVLKDSITNENTRREIEQIGAAYALEKKDHQIQLLEQQRKLQQAKSKRQLLVRDLLIVVAISLMVFIVFALNRKYLRRKNRLQQEINLRQNELFNITATVEDKERKRIAKDLHDGMGTLLSAAKLKLSALQQDSSPPVRDTLVLLDDAISELRNISHNLMPATLSRLGLVAALQNLFDKIHSLADLEINLVVHGFEERISEEKEMILYRVVLELVNNVVKHAEATMLTVQLVKYPGEIVLTVEDNGRGFSYDKMEKWGIGLSNIGSRISYLEGNFHIDSTPGSGTTVIIDVPA
jgi:two-component system, NarL family, sensor kinase